jgi:choline dehydrogenase-like flavoprotein
MSVDSIYQPEVMAAAQKALVEAQCGPLTAIQSVQGFFPCNLFLEEGELDEIVQSIESTKSTTEFQKKQRDQIIAHIKNPKSANLQFVLVAATVNLDDGVSKQAQLFPPPKDLTAPNGVTFAVCLQYPVSRGTIHITTSDPTAHPRIDPNYLNHPADVAVLAAGLKFAEKMAQAPALQGVIEKRVHPPLSTYPSLDTVAERRRATKDYCLGEYHSCGSCAMGATVDSRLRVFGVKGLRVADASVFANNVSGNIVSSVYMIAERASDLIKEDWDSGKVKTK